MLSIESRGPVLEVRLNRPEVRNAFNDALIAALYDVFHNLGQDVRAVLLSGEGKSFCAGGDLTWMKAQAAASQEHNERDALKLAQLFDAIVSCPAVVVACVRGAAFGGGCGLVAASDVAIAEAGSQFAFSEVRLGLVPATISSFVIPKIGAGNARAYFSTGEAFDERVALRIGLIHEICEPGGLAEAANRKLKAVLAAGPRAAHQSKLLAQRPPLSMSDAAKLLANIRASEEGKEGVAAFLEKRRAAYVVEP